MDNYTNDLLEEVKRGNIDAFEHIYQMYKDKIYAISLSTLKNPQDAEDAVQQTFIKVYEKLSTLQDNNAFNTWIQRIAINESNTILRKRRGDISIDDEETGALAERIEDDFMLPQEYAEREDLSLRLREIINELPPVQRQALVLRMYSNLSIAEISQIMECTESTTKSRIRYAKAYIRTEIEERERKSGEKFYGAAVLPFGTVFANLVRSQSMSSASVTRIWSAISEHILALIASAGGASGVGGGVAAAGGAAAKTGLALGAKIAIGAIIGAAVIAGSAFGIMQIVKANSESNDQTDAITETVAETAEATTKATQPATAAPTESPKAADHSKAYASYLRALEANESDIRSYENPKYGNSEKIVRPVAIADVTGDNAPDLIMIKAPGENGGTLSIMSYNGESVSEIYQDNSFAVKVSQGPGYYLFMADNNLYSSSANGGQYSKFYTYTRYDASGDSEMTATEALYGLYVDGNYSSDPDRARVNGAATDLATFEAERAKLVGSADRLLMAFDDSVVIDPVAQKRFNSMKNEAMTYDEAIAFLRGSTTDTEETDDKKAEAEESGVSAELLSEITGAYSSPDFGYGRGAADINDDGTIVFKMPPINGYEQIDKEYEITSLEQVTEYSCRITYVGDDGEASVKVYLPGAPISEIHETDLGLWLKSDEDKARETLHKKIIVNDAGGLFVCTD